MADNTKIEWADATWNPVRGCTRVSPGCGGPNHEGGCYAEKVAARFSGPGQPYHGFAERTAHGGRWTGKVALIDSQLDLPLRWKKPRRIFVNSMSDLFHEALPDEAIDRVFAVMALARRHIFIVLTKRPQRMREYLRDTSSAGPGLCVINRIANHAGTIAPAELRARWPLQNVWLVISVEDQPTADLRIPELLDTPAAVRGISAEPLLGRIDLNGIEIPLSGAAGVEAVKLSVLRGGVQIGIARHLDWVIIGGESGPGARAFRLEWARALVEQCRAASVACFVKQLGANPRELGGLIGDTGFSAVPKVQLRDKKGGDWSEWPGDLRVREFPRAHGDG